MDLKQSGSMMRDLRKQRNLTQKQVADALGVCPKTVSKWETGNGFPDVENVTGLAEILGVSTETILKGSQRKNREEVGNMKRIKFYVCPLCGNVAVQLGEGEFVCCGQKLSPLKPQKAEGEHCPNTELIESEEYVTFRHPMTKQHYLSFVAGVRYDSVLLTRLYPEQDPEVRIPRSHSKHLFFYCSQHGLFEQK